LTTNKFGKNAARVVLIASLAVGAALAGAGTASAVDVTGEGAVGDSQNIIAAAVSDATAGGVVSGPLTDAAAGRGCKGSAQKPVALYYGGSSTGVQIRTDFVLQCTGYNSVDLYTNLERHRWYGWQYLAGTHNPVDNSTQNFTKDTVVTTDCRAGTWSYRSHVFGNVNGVDNDIHSESLRISCVNPNDVNYIDLS
jgi:hypothetical protein